jgi:hypothetical protein
MKKWFLNLPLVAKVRLKIGSYFLDQEMRQRKRSMKSVGLTDARNIGILFNAKDEKTFKVVREFAQELRAGGLRTVKGLGYVPSASVEAFQRASQDFEFFFRDDFNFYFRPQGRKVAAFTGEQFDILIDLRMKRFIPLLFIVGLSKAKFKVGRLSNGDEDFYDLMIRVGDNEDLTYFVSQVKHYLNMLDQ